MKIKPFQEKTPEEKCQHELQVGMVSNMSPPLVLPEVITEKRIEGSSVEKFKRDADARIY